MKIWTIAWKDTLIRFRDRNALILMILAPLVISLIIGSAFSGFISGSDPTPFDPIPVLLVNEDAGQLGQEFADILMSEGLADLLAVEESSQIDSARQLVQQGEVRAAVFIPENFSEALEGGANPASDGEQGLVQFYADPSATLTPNIARGVVLQILNSFIGSGISAQISVEQLLETGGPAVAPQLANLEPLLVEAINTHVQNQSPQISLNSVAVGETGENLSDISPFAFFAPSMGILFLMFAMMDGTRSILEEEKEGTLDRLVSTPTSHQEILLGKIGGVFLTGILQFVVFVFASRLFFQLKWGSSIVGLIVMTVAIVLSLTSLGAFIAAFARDLNQAAILGTVVTLLFAALGGNFAPAQNFPDWLQPLSKLTLTRWGLDGFSDLTILGLGTADILLEAAVLLGIGLVLFGLALFQFQRRIAR